MKTLFLTLMLALAFVSSALAAPATKQVVMFSNISAASAAVKTSSVVSITPYKFKSLHVSGVTLTSSLTSPTFKNMSGTLVAQCAPTSNGPWSTCATDDAQTAVSRTTNGNFSWHGVSSYLRLQWTSGTIGGKLKAWLNLSE